ncbi:MAG: sulfotransferase [Microcystaceae cyanobacterium]
MYFHSLTLQKALKESYFSPNRTLSHSAYVTLFISLFFPVRTLVLGGQLLDNLLYPSYQQQEIIKPILITGNPRSGTTFLHRLLAKDCQFSSTKLYHTIFPSVSFYRLFDIIEKPLNSLMTWLDKRSFGGWQGIHKTELNGYEEDETLFVWSLLTPVISLLFPFPKQLETATWVDKLPQQNRDQLMGYYQNCLKRHLYAEGTNKTLLTKNTTCTGRLASMLEQFPDTRVIHLIRHPYQAIPSLLSMYAVPWRKFAPQTKKTVDSYESLARLYADYYRYRMQLFQVMGNQNSANLTEISYQKLVNDPLTTVETIYQKFGLEMSPVFRDKIKQETQLNVRYQSHHHYSLEQFGLSQQQIYEMMPDVFEFYGFNP